MPARIFAPDEARREIQRLRALPATPMRSREIAGLERALMVNAASASVSGPPRSAAVRRARKEAGEYLSGGREDDTPDPPSKPEKEVQRIGERRRVIVRKVAARQDHLGQRADAEYERDKVHRLDDIKGLLGTHHRSTD
jgi:hypothetical protein